MINTWVCDFHQVPGKALPNYDDQVVVQRAFDYNLELTAGLEKRGFEGVFYTEHHFLNAMSPCPNLLVAALAAKTTRLKIGVMGNVLAFHQPWRLAEELAMLDYLTQGRLEIGVAAGVPPEFLFVGIPQPEVRPRYTEILDFLQKAEQQGVVTHRGEFFDFEEVPIMPRPRKERRRRHWMTIYSENSCRDAARRNFKVCTGFQPVEGARKAFDAYRDEAAKLGRSVGPDDIGVRRQILVWDTDAEAEALNRELQEAAQDRLAQTFKGVLERQIKAGVGPAESVLKSGVMDAATVTREPAKPSEGAPKLNAKGALDVASEEFIAGSPATVADQIIDQCRRMGAGNIVAYHNPTMSEEQLAHNYALWEQVIPILRRADLLDRRAAE